MQRYSFYDVIALLVTLAGIGFVGSGLITNPFVAQMMSGGQAIDRLDVLWGYLLWSVALGVCVIVLAGQLGRSPRGDGLVVLALLLSAMILADRYLLAKLGLPLWEHDPALRYRHRAGAVRLVNPNEANGRVYVINRHGHHDEEISVDKPEGELRGLMLGDSVTMGYGVVHEETYATQLERILSQRDRAYRFHQMINTGVHGYSTRQERQVLERSLRFEPDFVALGFCMNDVTEPFIVDEELGGTGIDYHAVSQTPSRALGFLLNETGFGRLAQLIQARGTTLQAEKLREIFDVRAMAAGLQTEPRFIEAWALVRGELDRIHALVKSKGLPFVLLIFPFDFQLIGEPSLRAPQDLLKAWAAERGVDAIDLTPVLRDAVYSDPELMAAMRARGYDTETIEKFYEWRKRIYFFDEDHFTVEGNRLVAEQIYEWLASRGLVGEAPASGPSSATARHQL